MNGYRKNRILLVLSMLLVGVAFGGCGSPPAPAAGPTSTSGGGGGGGGPQVEEPTMWEDKPTFCSPGERRCQGTNVEECDPKGEKWVKREDCQAKGVTCGDGVCLDNCGKAEISKSYIGCDYWAFPLDNVYSWQDDDPDDEDRKIDIPKDSRPPYAVVLANPSTSDSAWVSVKNGMGDSYADLITDRLVAQSATKNNPDGGLQTVHSELIAHDGVKRKKLSGKAKNLVLPPGATMVLLLSLADRPVFQSSISATSFHIYTSQPVVAYQFNPFCCNYSYTNDASLLLPTSTLTGHYMYIGYPVWNGGSLVRRGESSPSTLSVVATRYATTVKVKLKDGVSVDRMLRELNGSSKPKTSPKQGDTQTQSAPKRVRWDPTKRILSARLKPFEVLNLAAFADAPAEDMTGTFIEANQPVAVFSGHNCAFVPFSLPACDHLESQLFPRETWSNQYIATPLKLRGAPEVSSREATYFKFAAEQDGTEIDVGIPIDIPNVANPAGEGTKSCAYFATDTAKGKFTLNAGDACEFGARKPFKVISTKPLQLGAFLSGQNSVQDANGNVPKHAGDPTFFIVPPVDQYRTSYNFFSPPTYYDNYATIIARAGDSFSIDNTTIDINAPGIDKAPLSDGSWVRYHIPLQDGPHSIKSITPVGLIVYGYDSYVSYAYTGGLDLTKLRSLSNSL